MSIRKACFSGSFYPDSKEELERYFKEFNNYKLKEDVKIKEIRAIIVPHAGYIYSGFTANLAYAFAAASKNSCKKVFIVGPAHRVYLEGASVAIYEEYETPHGNIKIDIEYSKNLLEKFDFLEFNQECEFEHSTETQAPFVKNYFPNAQVVEIVYGKIDFKDLTKVINYILEDKENLVVISSDLSHFYSLEDAQILDNNCISAIQNKNLDAFKDCEACGKTGIKAIIDYAIQNEYKSEVLHYCTSADVTNDKKSVVGYTSALIGK